MRNQKAKAREKKTPERQAAEELVDQFLDWLFSSDRDAGWHGLERLGRLIDFKGDLPQGSGFAGFDRYEREIRYLRHISDQTRRAIELVDSLPQSQRSAVLSDRAYRGRTKVAVDPFQPEKPVEIHWSTSACAQALGMSEGAYRLNVNRGYRALEVKIEERRAA